MDLHLRTWFRYDPSPRELFPIRGEECPEALVRSVGASAIVSKSESASVLIDKCRSLFCRKAA